jgi:hypothetical protein
MFRRHCERGIAWALGRIAAPAAANPEVQAAEFARGAVAAAATDAEHDALRARVDARIAADPQWAVRLRPRLVPLRGLPAAERPAAAARIVGEAVTAAAERPAAGRPNIVLFVADDLGSGELGCSGNASAVTPHLDRFAATGLTLTDCHSASSCCSPSRAALLTGRHAGRAGGRPLGPVHRPGGGDVAHREATCGSAVLPRRLDARAALPARLGRAVREAP